MSGVKILQILGVEDLQKYVRSEQCGGEKRREFVFVPPQVQLKF
jgi:hypothetical protein